MNIEEITTKNYSLTFYKGKIIDMEKVLACDNIELKINALFSLLSDAEMRMTKATANCSMFDMFFKEA